MKWTFKQRPTNYCTNWLKPSCKRWKTCNATLVPRPKENVKDTNERHLYIKTITDIINDVHTGLNYWLAEDHRFSYQLFSNDCPIPDLQPTSWDISNNVARSRELVLTITVIKYSFVSNHQNGWIASHEFKWIWVVTNGCTLI